MIVTIHDYIIKMGRAGAMG